ncbi:MAG: cation:proton antiporter [Bacilli bacterium]
MGQFFCIALALIIGLLSSRLMNLIKLPNITGYLIAGIIMGPFVLGPYIGGWSVDGGIVNGIQTSNLYELNWITDLSLAFIAFSIGSSFNVSSLKKVGGKVITITIFEALGGAILTLAGLFIAYAFNREIPIPTILTLSAIACATAPAATLLVIKQYKAKGPVVNTLLPVVAMDDAVALIAFALLFGVSKTMANGSNLDAYEIIGKPILEILISLGAGVILGLIISFACKAFKSRNNRLIWICFVVASSVGLAYVCKKYLDLGASSLLCSMTASAFFSNLRKDSTETYTVMEHFTAPLFMLFFIISGAHLDLRVFADQKYGLMILLIAGVYVISRAFGKRSGAALGAKITKSEPVVQKYLGLTLIPQAGVAIGLATQAGSTLGGEIGSLIISCVLVSTLIYELVGPVLTKYALTKAGEIIPPEKKQIS